MGSPVRVERVIVHLINHLKQQLTHSEEELPINSNLELREYFGDQVQNAINDQQITSARFSPNGNQATIQEIYKILNHSPSFVSSSKVLADLLMKAMGTDGRIKPESATVAVCTYSDGNSNSAQSLALIKLDPSNGFAEKVITVDGKQIVTFEPVKDMMPTKEVKLRKAALIPPKGAISNIDLHVLDRQVAGVAANFFGVTFLNTLPVLDPVNSVKEFVRASEKTRRTLMDLPVDKPERIGPEESDLLMRHVEDFLRKGRVNKRQFVKQAPLNTEGQKLLAKQLDKVFPHDPGIKFDRAYAKKVFLSKVRYRGGHGVLFEVDADRFGDVVRSITPGAPLSDGTPTSKVELIVPNLHRITG